MSERIFSRKNVSRAGWVATGGFALSSVVEGLLDQEWGMGNELGILLSVIVALLAGGPRPFAHTGGGKKD